MNLIPIKFSKNIFCDDFFEKDLIKPFYQKLYNETNHEDFLNTNFKSNSLNGNTIQEIKFIPSYFKSKHNILDSNYNCIAYKRINNFRINLEGYQNAKDFLAFKMGSKSRSQIRRRIQRLETCFNIKYKFYYGHISKKTMTSYLKN